jgi:hypothetical protein
MTSPPAGSPPPTPPNNSGSWVVAMADWRDELENAREDARRARAEAQRLRNEARELERRLRQEERQRSREERHSERAEAVRIRLAASGRGPGGMPPPPSWTPESAEGARAEQAFSLDGVTTVHVDQTAGRVTIRPCREGETPGVVSSGNKSAPRLEVTPDGDRLVIEIKLSTGWLFRRKQGATTVVRLLPQVGNLRLDLGYGEAHIREIHTDSLRIDVGAGTITTAQTSGHLRANVGAGKLGIHGHSGLADCDTGTGDVLVDISHLVPGEYRIDAGIGRAEVRLPADGQVYIRASSGMGKTRIEYPSAPEGAPTSLKINTGVGEVSVRARQPGDDVPPPAPPVQAKPQRGARAPQPRRREAEELRVLQLLEQGRITSQEAADLIAALQGAAAMAEGEEEAAEDAAPEPPAPDAVEPPPTGPETQAEPDP